MYDRLTILRELLHSHIEVNAVVSTKFLTSATGTEEISSSHRFHLIVKGALIYTIGDHTITLQTGDQTFVPAWQRRHWKLKDEKPCEIVFCAFTTRNHLAPEAVIYRRRPSPKEFVSEKAVFEKMRNLFGSYEKEDRLLVEGELKAILARFFVNAEPQLEANAELRPGLHPEILRSIRWLAGNYQESDALERLYGKNTVTPNYFRILFHEATGESPRAYINRLRLLRARHLLKETDLSVKEVAFQTGFPDAIYFSRRYREFWKNPPSQDKR